MVNMDDAIQDCEHLMNHRTGVPLILEAMACSQTVQVVAKWPLDALAANPAFALDPLFREILPMGGLSMLDGGGQQGLSVDAMTSFWMYYAWSWNLGWMRNWKSRIR